jgi:hypothetical protein
MASALKAASKNTYIYLHDYNHLNSGRISSSVQSLTNNPAILGSSSHQHTYDIIEADCIVNWTVSRNNGNGAHTIPVLADLLNIFTIDY